MIKSTYPLPTDKELQILSVLWANGPSSVRDVHEVIALKDHTGYTTTLKLMQIMMEKGLLTRDDRQKIHIYRSKFRQEKVQKRILCNMAKLAFSGSIQQMVIRTLSLKKLSAEEIDEIKKALPE